MTTAPAHPPSNSGDPIGIYIHWPFCLSKCPYCDFNSHVRARVDEATWQASLLRELDHFAALMPGRTVGSVFFGGGTPSLMPPATTAALIERIHDRWDVTPDLEITLEANPTSVEAERFAGFRAAGVNRLSMGVQSLRDAELKFLGRGHSADEAKAAIRLARKTFDRMSFDLIYARPHQTVSNWQAELNEAMALAADHLSLYQLTIEEGTAFANIYRRGGFTLPDEDTAAALYEVTLETTAKAGLPAYEISNHAVPGAECRHNLLYWRYGDYAGVGPGAHGRLLTDNGDAIATAQAKKPEDWLAAVERDGHGTVSTEKLRAADRAVEMVMMGLRLRAGLDTARFARRIGQPVTDYLNPTALADAIAHDLLVQTPGNLRTTEKGAAVLNRLLGELLS
ncbi:radical SAM family heme chaperone HemW [Govanella unica]|uniref:Heme chaperone HemW n=1 Tax=Govanella unica TaxID=2975056 RepID=A0A9X3TZP4_9PROT|nr:radical SAM family heme chaperone HemW [Govania unica]MDA5194652.1 radical SAM family heme chaperone HemW [Govania unica]